MTASLQNDFAKTAEITENEFAKLNIDAANIFFATHNSRHVAQLMRYACTTAFHKLIE